MQNRSSIPLVRLSLLLPFVEELDRRGLNSNAALAGNGLVRNTLMDYSVFVPVVVIHRFLEDAAEIAEDPHFGVAVGESLDLSSWSPIFAVARKSRNLAGFLIRFIRAAAEEASSAVHELHVGSKFASFRERRTSEQEILPAQNDAFTAAFTLSLLRRAAGPIWNPEQVRLTVCNPEVLPKRYQGVHVFGGDRMGMSVCFPTAWLVEPFNQQSFLSRTTNGKDESFLPKQFIEALQHVIIQHLDKSELSLPLVAAWAGTSPQTLQRKLRSSGTTLSEVVRNLKRDRAIDDLVQTKRSVGQISSGLGFSNPNSFTRAFKSWTGLSPLQYRKLNRV